MFVKISVTTEPNEFVIYQEANLSDPIDFKLTYQK